MSFCFFVRERERREKRKGGRFVRGACEEKARSREREHCGAQREKKRRRRRRRGGTQKLAAERSFFCSIHSPAKKDDDDRVRA